MSGKVSNKYIYRGELADGVAKGSNMAGMLARAILADSAASATPPHDR